MKFFGIVLSVVLMSLNALAIDCHGTEPFWAASVTNEKVTVTYPGEVTSVVLPVTSIGAAAGYTSDYVQIHNNDNGPVAIVTKNKCSDGMSDFTYPSEVYIFTGSATLYGCCGEGVME